MKINYDRAKCCGHNRCYSLAPEIWDVDDEGYAILRIEGDILAITGLQMLAEGTLASAGFRRLQTGNVQTYLTAAVLGVVALAVLAGVIAS